MIPYFHGEIKVFNKEGHIVKT